MGLNISEIDYRVIGCRLLCGAQEILFHLAVHVFGLRIDIFRETADDDVQMAQCIARRSILFVCQ